MKLIFIHYFSLPLPLKWQIDDAAGNNYDDNVMTEQCNGSKSHDSNSTFGSKRKLLNSCKFINLSTNWCCGRITGIFYRDVNISNCRGESCANNCYKLSTIFIVYTSSSTQSKFFILKFKGWTLNLNCSPPWEFFILHLRC